MNQKFLTPIKWHDEDMRQCGQCHKDFKRVVSVVGFAALKETWFCDTCLQELKTEIEAILPEMKPNMNDKEFQKGCSNCDNYRFVGYLNFRCFKGHFNGGPLFTDTLCNEKDWTPQVIDPNGEITYMA